VKGVPEEATEAFIANLTATARMAYGLDAVCVYPPGPYPNEAYIEKQIHTLGSKALHRLVIIHDVPGLTGETPHPSPQQRRFGALLLDLLAPKDCFKSNVCVVSNRPYHEDLSPTAQKEIYGTALAFRAPISAYPPYADVQHELPSAQPEPVFAA
jgi:hypothetical protein